MIQCNPDHLHRADNLPLAIPGPKRKRHNGVRYAVTHAREITIQTGEEPAIEVGRQNYRKTLFLGGNNKFLEGLPSKKNNF